MHSSLLSLITLAGAALAAKSAGCGKTPAITPGHHGKQTINSANGGGNRDFILAVPSTYDANTAVPLILSFHGAGKNMTNQLYLSEFVNEDWNPHAISVYPNSAAGYWRGTPDRATPDDLAFTQDLINHVEDTLCIETTREYCSGKSLGGGFCNVLACDARLSANFAAIAPVSGAYYTTPANETFASDCHPNRTPIPVLEFHGLADTTIPYAGGLHKQVHLRSVPDWALQWAVTNGCAADAQPVQTTTNGGVVEIFTFDCGADRGIVTHYAIKGLAHTWPSTGWNPDNGGSGTVIDATPIIMDFFNNYTLPAEKKTRR